jgi:NAD(P)-dependent dehydrogenase (short-subunit alcohol dehydrogenase family)
VNQIDLQNHRAVITGGAQGIGRAVAERLLASGASISLWDRNAPLLEQAANELRSAGTVHTACVDITDLPAVREASQAASTALGPIDILIANAGITGPNQTVWDYPSDAWRQVIDVCLTGTFCCLKTLVPGMIQQNYGRIVNVASVAGKEGNPNASAYSAAKAGVIALTKSLGKELANYNISVNCVTPAAARTRIFDQMSQQHIDYMLSKIPRGRFAEISEIASMIAWLVSEENSFTTGAVFDLSGGRATY